MPKNHFTLKYNIFFGFIATILVLYVFIRAYHLSFTHDESLSFTIIEGMNKWINTANNHLLNTLLMCWCKKLFGMSEYSLRLPNLLAFLLYLLACFFLFKQKQKIWLSLLGLSIVLLNPFFIEFFSLARGYGLSLGFMTLSLYFMFRNINPKIFLDVFLSDFILTSLFAALALYANLALINYFICVLIVFVVKYIAVRKHKGASKSFDLKFWGIFIFSFIPIILGILRLLHLKKLHELYFGASSLVEGYETLLTSSIQPNLSLIIIIFILKILTIVPLIVGGIYIIVKRKYQDELFYIAILVSFLLLGLVFEHIIFGAKYPSGRTALFYIPILALFNYHLFATLIDEYNIKGQYYKPLIFCIMLLMIINFVAKANISKTTTWSYDAHTKDVMKYLKEDTKKSVGILSISNHWLFEPTINYYIKRWDLNFDAANRDGIHSNCDYIYKFKDSNKPKHCKTIKEFPDTGSELFHCSK